ncbi:MAG: Hpt domain-containing protein [Deltaproteobacteria bacterium]|nr:Hpt domain-containing protein [Deltaproteobacteria bacterium]
MERYDLELIGEVASLDRSEDCSFFRSQMQRFHEHSQQHMGLMREALSNGDMAAIEASAHAMGGSAVSFGAAYLGSVLRRIEVDCRQMTAEVLRGEIHLVGEELAIFREFLEEYVENMQRSRQ